VSVVCWLEYNRVEILNGASLLCVCVRVCAREDDWHISTVCLSLSITVSVYTQPPRLPCLVIHAHLSCLCTLLGNQCCCDRRWSTLAANIRDMSADDVIIMRARCRYDVITFCCLLAVTCYTHALTGEWRHHACPTWQHANIIYVL